MATRVKWNLTALRKFNEVVGFLLEEYGNKTADIFVDRVDRVVDKVIVQPDSGRRSRKFKQSGHEK